MVSSLRAPPRKFQRCDFGSWWPWNKPGRWHDEPQWLEGSISMCISIESSSFTMNHPWIFWIYSSEDSLRISPTCPRRMISGTFVPSPSSPRHPSVNESSKEWCQHVIPRPPTGRTQWEQWDPNSQRAAGTKSSTTKIYEEWSNKVDIFHLRYLNFDGFPQFPTIVFRSLGQVDQVELDISCLPADSLSRFVDTKGTSGCSLICDASNRNWNPQLDGQPTSHGRKCYIRQIQFQWVKLTTLEAKSPWQSRSARSKVCGTPSHWVSHLDFCNSLWVHQICPTSWLSIEQLAAEAVQDILRRVDEVVLPPMAAMGNGVPIYGNLLVGIIIMMVKQQMLVGDGGGTPCWEPHELQESCFWTHPK